MSENGFVKTDVKDKIATVTFFHPKSNSLPGDLLTKLADEFKSLKDRDDVNVIILKSEGDKAFCAGASFDELLAIEDFETGKKFFMGFANVINAMKKCPQFIVARVHGKIVGGGVGLTASSDYVFAHESASVKLSELALGIGPFVVGPAVERKVGTASFTAMSIDYDWRDSSWAKEKGLYTDVFSSVEQLDASLNEIAVKLSNSSPEAMKKLKEIFWEGTDNWDSLLEERAEISGRLVLSDFTKNYIQQFKKK
ncbi:MAG: enoyl-CoA hydratase/isomerase family protein [Melioribacteraceae bacterium]|nr:enoyl-CoA hydratase/isomerase family protein [Melioribacteraceae bacterium]MCF8355544.1 enoyl-CoA hydratase/isomerase family protein [Melioribacteraceae bacterium]MCF8394219.1 enoyl-CoA hydratase/isomerase family protein [Melioribacteraceae bacterium]MCF8419939.1 enoyl-CoA hydratase/isomerase family protein [Melioribacteraceae bacterium]